jgi:cell division initiation protein
VKKFSYEESGYNKEEVNAFIDEVINNTEYAINTCKEQRKEIEELKKEIMYYRNIIDKVENNSSNEEASDIRKKALRDAEDIITSAKNNASMIVNDALIKAYELNSRNETIEKNYALFKKKLEVLTTEYKAVLDELNSLDYKD